MNYLIVNINLIFGLFLISDTAPLKNEKHLFQIERSKDKNAIYYDLNMSNGRLNKENPIDVYWIKHEQGETIEPLTWIQQKYAYGIRYLSKGTENAEFQFVSYDKRNFYLRKDKHNNFRVYTISDNRVVEVKRIFIQIDGGTFWFPQISRVELHASEPLSSNTLIEIIKP